MRTGPERLIHSYNPATVTACVDDVAIVAGDPASLRPPWPGQYKIRPEDQARLTAADVVGPDGIVYPNWSRCGVEGGIPVVAAAVPIEDCGGRAGDGADDAGALVKACRAAAARGGGAVVFGEGTYHLDRPVTIRDSGVVIRGQGAGKTRLIFRYALPTNGIAFYWPPPGGSVGKSTPIELHAVPKNLQRLTIRAGELVLARWERSTHSGNTFWLTTTGVGAAGKLPDGERVLVGIAEYADGTRREVQHTVRVDAGYTDPEPVAEARAAIGFFGRGPDGRALKLARDGQRGDRVLELESAAGLAAGDLVQIEGPAAPRWKQLTRNACPWGNFRRYQVRLASVSGATVRLEQPLRIEFPVIDGSLVRKLSPIQRCGVEDLAIEQTEDLWITSVLFKNAWNCWARGVFHGGDAQWHAGWTHENLFE